MSDTITRVRFFDRQFLCAQDFTDEQAYHVAMRRRHNIGHHTWGIVAGLEVVQDKDGRLSVLPGVAVDGYGRELLLSLPQPLDKNRFDEFDSDTLNVWLEYERHGSDAASNGFAACKPDAQAAPYRWREQAQVALRPPDARYSSDPNVVTERRLPEGLDADDQQFGPTRTPPDDPEQRWPVFLAQITRTRGQQLTYAIDTNGRPYAGLVGASIHHPTRQARVQIGPLNEGDQQQFAVFLSPDSDADAPPRFAIDQDGELHIRGDTRLFGDLALESGAIEFGAGPAYSSAMPWRIYHAGPTDSASSDTGDLEPHELRIEIATNPDGVEKPPHQLVIGSWSDQKKTFVPHLTVTDKEVTVHGNLVVEGRTTGDANIEMRAEAPQQLSPEALAFRTNALLGAFTGAALLPRGPQVINLQDIAVLQQVVANLADADFRANFVEQVKAQEGLQQRLCEDLGCGSGPNGGGDGDEGGSPSFAERSRERPTPERPSDEADEAAATLQRAVDLLKEDKTLRKPFADMLRKDPGVREAIRHGLSASATAERTPAEDQGEGV